MANPQGPRQRRLPYKTARLDMLGSGRFSPDLSDLAGNTLQTPRLRRPPEAARRGTDLHYAWAAPDGSVRRESQRLPAGLGLVDLVTSFARGTLIETVSGQVAVEDLVPGDRLMTADNGPQVLRWIGACLPLSDRGPQAASRFVRIRADAFGPALPSHDIVVSERFRLLRSDRINQSLHGGAQVLVPIGRMIDGVNVVEVRPGEALEFFAIVCDSHEIISANRLATETFHPGLEQIALMSDEARLQLGRLFPHLGGELYGFGPVSRPRPSLPHEGGPGQG